MMVNGRGGGLSEGSCPKEAGGRWGWPAGSELRGEMGLRAILHFPPAHQFITEIQTQFVDGLVSQVCGKTSQEGLTRSPAGEEGRGAGA